MAYMSMLHDAYTATAVSGLVIACIHFGSALLDPENFLFLRLILVAATARTSGLGCSPRTYIAVDRVKGCMSLRTTSRNATGAALVSATQHVPAQVASLFLPITCFFPAVGLWIIRR
jgi:hypothetical protein